MRYQGTDIDGPRTDPDQLLVRGINLVDIMGTKTFLESAFLVLYDKFPTEAQRIDMNRFYGDAFSSIGQNDPLFEIIPAVATSSDESLNAMIAGLAVDRKEEIKSLNPPDFGDIHITKLALAGFYFMAILPIIAGLSAAYPVKKDMKLLKKRLLKAQASDLEFTDRIALFFRGIPLEHPGEKKLLESILVAFSTGFGYMTPSIMTPRISIGSGVSVGLAMVAACTTAGPFHLGTSQNVIEMFQELQSAKKGRSADEYVQQFITEKLEGGGKLLGFGHPFFKKDPRVIRLIELLNETGLEHTAIDLFYLVCKNIEAKKNIFPNLEAIHGALMTTMGFEIPFHGPSIALIGRSAGMLAHMEERLAKPAFGVKNEVARNFFDKVPMGWL